MKRLFQCNGCGVECVLSAENAPDRMFPIQCSFAMSDIMVQFVECEEVEDVTVEEDAV